MRLTFLPFAPPTIGTEEIAEVVDTLGSGWISTGPKTRRFEQLFAERCHAPAALALNSGTAGLHLALAMLSVGPGDEVVTTPLTFAASVNVIEHVGARPIFVDVDPMTLTLDAGLLEFAITPRTKAIIAVHYAGHPVDLDPILSIADRYGISLIEDAAHAIPAAYKGRPIGSGDNFASFSFYATKNLTTGEGGMVTAHPEYIEKARLLSLHGMSRDAWNRYAKGGSWRYEILSPGFKYNMSDIQASLGLRQLDKLAPMHERRKAIAAKYSRAFSDYAQLQVPTQLPSVDHAWHLYVLRLRPETLRVNRDTFVDLLVQKNIGCSVHFIPMHMQRYYREKYAWQPRDFPVTYDNFVRMLSLPLHPGLDDSDVNDVIEAVTTLVETNLR
jgi:dTDP-4-amino-4,6-dideoxygalactose transaminase